LKQNVAPAKPSDLNPLSKLMSPLRDILPRNWFKEEEFDRVADTFRDKRVWVKDNSGKWIKSNIWD
jgi:hypothetical protein